MTDAYEQPWVADIAAFLERPVPESAREHAVRTITDVLSAAVAGSTVTDVEAVGRGAGFAAGSSTVVGTDRRTEPGGAALVNAAASIAQEIEEGHNEGGHVGAGVVVGGFAVAEHEDIGGAAFVDACVKAYEVAARIEWSLQELKGELSEGHPWLVRNPHATWTPVGAALAAGLCMDLDVDRLLETVRVCANMGIVSMHDPFEEGSGSRNFMAGFSTQAGVSAALATATGLRGSRSMADRVYGPARDRDPDAFDRRFDELGSVWELTRNYFKYAPSCRFTHPALDALTSVRSDVDVDCVERIEVSSFRSATDLDYTDPAPFTSAKFSLPYVLASSLVRDGVTLHDFDADAVADESVRALAERVTVQVDPEYDAVFPEEWRARVAVVHEDGRTVTGVCRHPTGDYRNRPDDAAFRRKCHEAVAWRFGADRATTVVDALFDLRNRDVREVGAVLRADE